MTIDENTKIEDISSRELLEFLERSLMEACMELLSLRADDEELRANHPIAKWVEEQGLEMRPAHPALKHVMRAMEIVAELQARSLN